MIDREQQPVCLTVDVAVLTVRESALQVLVIERGQDPYQGHIALPGGIWRAGEDLAGTARRELAEQTGLDGRQLHLEQLASYSAPGRDPRGRVASVAHLAIAADLPVPAAGSDAANASWERVEQVRDRLAFDHAEILGDAVERARTLLEFTTLAAAFCGPAFTVSDLRQVYEVVWDQPVDPRNFSRKVMQTRGFLEPTGGKRYPDVGRPAALYRRGPAGMLSPPLMRSTTATV
jgi:8-oxo-dGTP diphosphatase